MVTATRGEIVNKTFRDQRTAVEKFVDEKLKEQILKGLERLRDEFGDEWVEHINPETLDLSNGAFCVLGQVYGNFTVGCQKLGIGLYSGAASLGFQRSDRTAEFPELTTAWLQVLTEDPYADLA